MGVFEDNILIMKEKLQQYIRSDDFNRLCSFALAILFALFFYSNFKAAQSPPELGGGYKLSIMTLMFFNGLLVYLLLTRNKPKDVSFAWQDLVATFLGTFFMLSARGVVGAPEILPLQVIGFAGLLFSIIGLITLRKSFGLLPADRGVVQHGVYRIVRHPIYAGYLVNYTCFLAQNYSEWNAFVFVVFVFFECYRLVREEKLLGRNPEYVTYTQTTKWRICPKIW